MAKFSVSKLKSQLYQFFPDLKPIRALDLRNYFSGLLDSYLPVFQFRTVKNNLESTDEIAIGDTNKISLAAFKSNLGGKLVAKPGLTYTLTAADHGNIYYNDSGHLGILLPDFGALPIGFEFGILVNDGLNNTISIDSGDGYSLEGKVYGLNVALQNLPIAGKHFIYLRLVDTQGFIVVDQNGIFYDTLSQGTEEDPILMNLNKGGVKDRDWGGGDIVTYDFNITDQGFDRMMTFEVDGNLRLSNAGLLWSQSIGRVLVLNEHATDEITVNLVGNRIFGVEENITIPAGETFYFEAVKAGIYFGEAYWTKAGLPSSGGGGSLEAINRTGLTINLNVKEAFYNRSATAPTGDLTFSTTSGLNGASGIIYWKAGANTNLPAITFSGEVQVDIDKITANAVHQIHFKYHKDSNENRLFLIFNAGNTPPEATDLSITGTFSVGGAINANHGYFDADGDLQDAGATIYQWWRAEDEAGENEALIVGATAQLYSPVGADDGKHHKCFVTVFAQTGSLQGTTKDTGWSSVAIGAAPNLLDIESALDYTIPSGGDGGSNGNISVINISGGVGKVALLPNNTNKIKVTMNVAVTGNFFIYLKGRSGSGAGYNSMHTYYTLGVGGQSYNVSSVAENSVDRPYLHTPSELGNSWWGWMHTQQIALAAGNQEIEIIVGTAWCAVDKVELVQAS